jgi:hypothetical protein
MRGLMKVHWLTESHPTYLNAIDQQKRVSCYVLDPVSRAGHYNIAAFIEAVASLSSLLRDAEKAPQLSSCTNFICSPMAYRSQSAENREATIRHPASIPHSNYTSLCESRIPASLSVRQELPASKAWEGAPTTHKTEQNCFSATGKISDHISLASFAQFLAMDAASPK